MQRPSSLARTALFQTTRPSSIPSEASTGSTRGSLEPSLSDVTPKTLSTSPPPPSTTPSLIHQQLQREPLVSHHPRCCRTALRRFVHVEQGRRTQRDFHLASLLPSRLPLCRRRDLRQRFHDLLLHYCCRQNLRRWILNPAFQSFATTSLISSQSVSVVRDLHSLFRRSRRAVQPRQRHSSLCLRSHLIRPLAFGTDFAS